MLTVTFPPLFLLHGETNSAIIWVLHFLQRPAATFWVLDKMGMTVWAAPQRRDGDNRG